MSNLKNQKNKKGQYLKNMASIGLLLFFLLLSGAVVSKCKAFTSFRARTTDGTTISGTTNAIHTFTNAISNGASGKAAIHTAIVASHKSATAAVNYIRSNSSSQVVAGVKSVASSNSGSSYNIKSGGGVSYTVHTAPPVCHPSCSASSSYCSGTSFSNGCGGYCNGTKSTNYKTQCVYQTVKTCSDPHTCGRTIVTEEGECIDKDANGCGPDKKSSGSCNCPDKTITCPACPPCPTP